MKNNNKREEILENVQRVVVKVGTSTLTTEDGRLNIEKIKKIVMQLNNLKNKGYDVKHWQKNRCYQLLVRFRLCRFIRRFLKNITK